MSAVLCYPFVMAGTVLRVFRSADECAQFFRLGLELLLQCCNGVVGGWCIACDVL